jgi:hypothetical protein
LVAAIAVKMMISSGMLATCANTPIKTKSPQMILKGPDHVRGKIGERESDFCESQNTHMRVDVLQYALGKEDQAYR